jgi:hypothetical protein
MKKQFALALFVGALSFNVSADHHAVSFEARQASSELEVTSIAISDASTTITAEGTMGEYGKVYVTYILHYDSATSGTVTGQGRGFVDEDTVASGKFAGIWKREGSLLTIRTMVNINDGTINMDVITMDGRGDTLTHDVYAVE